MGFCLFRLVNPQFRDFLNQPKIGLFSVQFRAQGFAFTSALRSYEVSSTVGSSWV